MKRQSVRHRDGFDSRPLGREYWVVLGSANGSTNLGDETMWEAAVKVVRERRGEVGIVTDAYAGWQPPVPKVTVLPYLYYSLRRGRRLLGPRISKRLPLVESVVSRLLRERYAFRAAKRSFSSPRGALQRAWFQAIEGSAGLIVSGAGAINDDYASHGIASWNLATEWAQQLGKPIAFVGQGIGPISADASRLASAEMLSRAETITVREDDSKLELQRLGVDTTAIVTPDWAILNTPSESDRTAALTLRTSLVGSADFLVLSLHRRHNTSKSDLRALSDLALEIVRSASSQGRAVMFVSNMTRGRYSDDRETARMISETWMSRDRENLIINDRETTPGVTRALLGLSTLVVTSRYHPLVFALSEGVPAVGISYDPYYDQKLSGASKLFGVDGNVQRLHEASGELLLDSPESQRINDADPLVSLISAPLNSFLDRVRSCEP